jgi:hypothetical protein
LIVAVLAMLVMVVFAGTLNQHADAAPSASELPRAPKLFSTDSTLEVTLSAPWRQFMRKKDRPARYPATLDYVDDAGATQHVAIAIEPRGITRLQVCKLPPVKLVFEKAAVKDSAFRGNKSLKLVTHCGNGERWEQYTVAEMLAYRIHNLVSGLSFRIRPLSIRYVDSADSSTDGPHFGFLIEDDSELAKRNHLEKLDIAKPRVSQLDPLETSRFAMFQFLIGNTDWAVLSGPTPEHCCHNSELIGSKSAATVFAVPYDFDSSGLVNAHYAAPNSALPIRSNRVRLFRGFCAHNSSLETARRELLALQPQIGRLVSQESRLTARNREAAQDYLAKGFEILRDDAVFARNVTEKCRK